MFDQRTKGIEKRLFELLSQNNRNLDKGFDLSSFNAIPLKSFGNYYDLLLRYYQDYIKAIAEAIDNRSHNSQEIGFFLTSRMTIVRTYQEDQTRWIADAKGRLSDLKGRKKVSQQTPNIELSILLGINSQIDQWDAILQIHKYQQEFTFKLLEYLQGLLSVKDSNQKTNTGNSGQSIPFLNTTNNQIIWFGKFPDLVEMLVELQAINAITTIGVDGLSKFFGLIHVKGQESSPKELRTEDYPKLNIGAGDKITWNLENSEFAMFFVSLYVHKLIEKPKNLVKIVDNIYDVFHFVNIRSNTKNPAESIRKEIVKKQQEHYDFFEEWDSGINSIIKRISKLE